MNKETLQIRQNYPLWMKIEITKNRLMQWIDYHGEDMVYISFSGGKDSTVLLHIARSMYPNIKAVYANTGNEFPEIVNFVRYETYYFEKEFNNIWELANHLEIDAKILKEINNGMTDCLKGINKCKIPRKNIEWVKPKKSFARILKEEGYPVLSKKSARMIRDLQNPTEDNAQSRKLYLSDYRLDKDGNVTDKPNKSFKLANCHRHLIDCGVSITEKCCHYLKKAPFIDYENRNKIKKVKKYDEIIKPMPIVGTQAEESQMREASYLKTGCNAFNAKKPKSQPLSFWTTQDILEYIDIYNVEIASIYGEVKKDEEGKYYTTGENRTGCVACGYGVHMEGNGDNRYLRLEQTHPKLHNHILNNLGFKEILDIMNIRYSKDQNLTEKGKLGGVKVEQYKMPI